MRKYERKMWYSNRPKPKPNPQQEPEARPLKTLLGENAPQVIVASQQEQKSVSLPGVSCQFLFVLVFLYCRQHVR